MAKKNNNNQPKKQGVFRMGTSNIVLAGNKQTFPEAYRNNSRLHYYSSLFNTVELNSSFYKIPLPATFKKWSLDVPDDFRFSVKLFRDISHAKQLEFSSEDIEQFMQAATAIAKAGCLLIQFPGKISFDYFSQVEHLLNVIASKDRQKLWRLAVEFRSGDWYTAETVELLNHYGASLVLHDIPKGKNNAFYTQAPFVYCRYHGPAGDYRGSYPALFLQQEAVKIKRWLKDGKDVYAYFNNTIGDAFKNAMTLRNLVKE